MMSLGTKQIQVYTVVDGKCDTYRTVFQEVLHSDETGGPVTELAEGYVVLRKRDDGVYLAEEYRYTGIDSIISNFLKPAILD